MNVRRPVGLSQDTWSLVQAIFPPEQQEDVIWLLVEECGRNLPFSKESDERGLERIRFAALKLSQGQVSKLLEAIILAQTDWRDLLVSAGFGDSVTEHLAWAKALIGQGK